MEFTQADIDSLAEKLDQLSNGEKAALSAAIEQHNDDVEGFGVWGQPANGLRFDRLDPLGLFGTTYGGDGRTSFSQSFGSTDLT